MAERDSPPAEENVYTAIEASEVPEAETPGNEQLNEFLNSLNIKDWWRVSVGMLGETLTTMVDPERLPEQTSIAMNYKGITDGIGCWANTWGCLIFTNSVFQVDKSGCHGYSYWFTTHYLLFKKDREELATKVEEVKQQILGSDDD